MRRIAVLALLLALSVSLIGSPGNATTQTVVFPSAQSQVVGSVGFINADQIGYFWSATRGDRVSQSFAGPPKVNEISLKVEVAFNNMPGANQVNWDVVINNTTVGSFTVNAGFLGVKTVNATFAPITGPNYAVTLRVTNTVPPGGGSHTLIYAGPRAHSLDLIYNSTCSSGGLTGQTLAEQLTGSDIDETGAVSGELHNAEAGAGPAAPAVHEAGCLAAAAGA